MSKKSGALQILLVEDDTGTLAVLEKNLSSWGYVINTANNGQQALEILEKLNTDIIVSDWLMPNIDGLELVKKVRSLNLEKYIYFILISSQDTRTDIVRGLQSGVDDFLAKPVNLDELRERLEIGERIISLERELNKKYIAIKNNYFQTIQMFITLMEAYSKNLGAHCQRVGKLCFELAQLHEQVAAQDYEISKVSGLMHDIGLIGLPETILSKKRIELIGDEYDLYRSHPVRGEITLGQIDLLKPVAGIVRMHHEQYNGRGFPDQLAGEQIPVIARIVCAANSYDNLIYRDQIKRKDVHEHLNKLRGYQLDPHIVDLLLEINEKRNQEFEKSTDYEIHLDKLKPAMVVAKDVHMKTGAFIMAAGTELDSKTIEKLKQYNLIGNISDTVFVHK
ncbi:MAG: response regulator [Desulfobacteraceae bacterium]|nr:response regulator [Desulfobacteraceae bacterium]